MSGAAIVHDEIAKRLGRHLPEGTQFEDVRGDIGLGARLVGRRFANRADVLVTTSTPLPLRLAAEHVLPIVFDVRWRWTRGPAARTYRHLDLARTARRADMMVTISHAVADQLQALRCVPSGGVRVVDLGPGQFDDVEPAKIGERDHSVVLIGSAPHKRNELAASLLVQIPSFRRSGRVTAISVSDAVIDVLTSALPQSQLDIRSAISRDELARTFATSRAYVALGTSEGFGFAYIEAAHQGCDVIAVRTAVTQEVLGPSALLLETSEPTPRELADALDSWDLRRVADLQHAATSRTWDRTAAQVAEILRSI